MPANGRLGGGMFGLNDKDKQDEMPMSQPDLVSKSNADLPDGLGGPAAASGPMPPIAAGPIESTMPNYPLPNSNPPSAPVLPQPTDAGADHTQATPPPT